MARVKVVVEGKEPVYGKPMSQEEAETVAGAINKGQEIFAQAGVSTFAAQVVNDD